MANLFDIISSPQYEQGGRFNLLSIPQLIYGFTGRGQSDIEQRRRILENMMGQQESATGDAALGAETSRRFNQKNPSMYTLPQRQGEADLFGTQARTASVEAGTRGQGIQNEVGEIQRRIAAGTEGDVSRNRMLFRDAYPGTSQELMQFQQGQEQYQRQKELGGFELDEARGLRQGSLPQFPLTGPGQAASVSKTQGGQFGQELAQREKQAKLRSIAEVVQQMLYTDPQAQQPMTQAYLKALAQGEFPIATFPQVGEGGQSAVDIEKKGLGSPKLGEGTPSPRPKGEAVGPAAGFGIMGEGIGSLYKGIAQGSARGGGQKKAPQQPVLDAELAKQMQLMLQGVDPAQARQILESLTNRPYYSGQKLERAR